MVGRASWHFLLENTDESRQSGETRTAKQEGFTQQQGNTDVMSMVTAGVAFAQSERTVGLEQASDQDLLKASTYRGTTL